MTNKEITFDKTLFRILQCAQPKGMGYVDDNKALKLMEDGYLIPSPKSKWHISGYKTTEKGTLLYNKWLKEMRLSHGHEWMTYADSEDKEAKTDYDKELDPFAYNEGEYHNGYKCRKCGFGFCYHCYEESDVPKCSEGVKNQSISDDGNLNKGLLRFR